MPILAAKQAARVASTLHAHPRVQTLRSNPAVIESTLYGGIPPPIRDNMFSWCHVRGPGRMTVEPLVFSDKESQTMSVVFHLGDGVAGYPGLVAGGVIATIMDEVLSRCSLIGKERHVAVTERLDIQYLVPLSTAEFYILEARVADSGEGSCRIEGAMKVLNSEKLTGNNVGALVTGIAEVKHVTVRSLN
ncbi:HotDog domain-containing protein [Aspergillus pseudoustus]|uniref:HotDog domain-containing protein n=1 Tax=Aspergillus pseudoustus TaxID=1810923 RepID=A0ABR4J4E8_9EURO